MEDLDSKVQRDSYALLPLRRGVLFPGSVSTIPVGRKASLALLSDHKEGDAILIGTQRDDSVRAPKLEDLHPIAVRGWIRKILREEDGSARLLFEAEQRMRLYEGESDAPYLKVVAESTESEEDEEQDEAFLLMESLRDLIRDKMAPGGKRGAAEAGALEPVMKEGLSSGAFADRVATGLPLDTEEAVEVLMTLGAADRLRLVGRHLKELIELREMSRKIESEVRERLSQGQREALLRERMRAIKNELGEGEAAEESELEALKKRLEEKELPQETRTVAERELKRLGSLNPSNPEFNVGRNYLRLILDLPWEERAEGNFDLDDVEARLNADHRGLEKVKERILEHMAVTKLAGRERGSVLCLSGPPGVGKTSLGASIAAATGRPYVRISLGGVRDEAEIRGHRRTYVGALPGRILSEIRKAGVKNPIVLLDEVDKLGREWGRAPESALLELLDPEQNRHFTDHYLELPFDLSEVMFICTVNELGALSGPLRDRLEVVSLEGYSTEEKREIAKSHLLPRKLEEHALPPDAVTLSDAAIEQIIRGYTREAGVRQLGRSLEKLCRAVALEVARSADTHGESPGSQRIEIDEDKVPDYLGKIRFFDEVAERSGVPGVATGLAWTPVGGDILFVETSRMPGKGALQITGKLGDVMQESARAALSYVRSHAEELGISDESLKKSDLHIHVPAGSVPKDGPSAGVTIFTALSSLFTGRKVRSDTAMTGECTLRGRVLPVGGIKAKVLAAHRAGLSRVILPRRNGRDLDELPDTVREQMEFILVEDMGQVLRAALEGSPEELNEDETAFVPGPEIGGGKRGIMEQLI